MYKRFIKPMLFLLSPERAHNLVMRVLKISDVITPLGFVLKKNYVVKSGNLKREVAGLQFENPVGMAAGFDKDAEVFEALGNFGFGFVEIGTVTPKAQTGNPKPRLFRLKQDFALINRMGFNNKGVDFAVKKLKNRKNKNLIIGGNIGKNKITPLDKAESDYVISFNKLFAYVDYFVINISSPNTPGLRKLQDKEPLSNLINTIQKLNAEKLKPKPVFLKIAPDLTSEQLDDIIEIVNNSELAGIIATNTTVSRQNLVESDERINAIGAGGLSGKPLKERSTEIIKLLRSKLNKEKAIIGVGGVSSGKDALEKLNAGADLVQLYTGFIYEGPGLVKKINRVLASSEKYEFQE